ncbi:helix-turn-helix domain-containing protein [Streptomyces sp. NRRL S-87]|uniref:helix-turn-helix domain-containing protein n=1 Tax=Streptomyces sp. NRRL S-87 TaxID=1463920 RepID=UPI0004BFB9CB|nr:helix-turn-helix domain-containing protein [Streptomyces sp. NRRL S-87]
MTHSVDTAAELTLPSPKERRRLREAGGLSPDELAAAMGVTTTTVRSWETGRTEPRGRKLEAYAKLLTRLAAETEPEAESVAETEEATPEPEQLGPDLLEPDLSETDLFEPTLLEPDPLEPALLHPGPKQTPPQPAAPKHSVRPLTLARHNPPHHAAVPAPEPSPEEPEPERTTEPEAKSEPPTPKAQPPTETHPTPETHPTLETHPTPGAQPTPETRATPDAHPTPEAEPTPTQTFDALYAYAAAPLARQAYLLTGRRSLAHEAVERAFQQAWQRWPEVATDRDPVGWVRAAVYEYALSPWHQLRRAHKHPDRPPASPADRALLDALLALPPVHRRTVLLYDGVGLDLPDTAAETEATTPTAGQRLVNAHAHLTARLPELSTPGALHHRLGSVVPAVALEPPAAAAVRAAGEHRARLWTRAALALMAAIAVATAYTVSTAPTRYIPPESPSATVSGVPPHGGPQRLTEADMELRAKLRSHPAPGPERLVPKPG